MKYVQVLKASCSAYNGTPTASHKSNYSVYVCSLVENTCVVMATVHVSKAQLYFGDT